MSTPAQVVEQAIQQGAEHAQNRHEELQDEQRKVTLDTLLEDAATPQDKVAAIQAVYHKDPSVLKQHVENMTRKLTGKPTQPVVSPQQAEAQRVAALGPRLKSPQQQSLDQTQKTLQWIQSLPPDQQRTAAQLLGIRETQSLKNFRNTKTGETITWDANQGTPGPDWVLAGTSSGSVRSLGYGVSAPDAIKSMKATGQQFAKPGGGFYTEQEISSLPPNMQLRAFAVGGNVYYGVANQNEHTVTLGNVVYPMDQFGQVDTSQPLGNARVGSTTTDPFGVSSTTTPATQGALGPRPSTPSATAPPATAPKGPAPRKNSGASRTQPTGTLDSAGHIPDSAGNPYLVQAANSLLDGMDVEKLTLPQKDRTAAMELAKKYGWKGQGLFTPREALQLREGATVIQQLLNSDALNVLDQGTLANLPMLGQSADPSKAGLWGRLATSLSSKAASPQQQEFLRYWRQMDALAVGLRNLVQTGRATQTQVDRLIAELPNPYNTTSSADARNRLRMVQSELRIAADSGKLPDVPLGDQPASGKQKAIVQHSPSTGQYRYSLDGGKTWQPGQPPNK